MRSLKGKLLNFSIEYCSTFFYKDISFDKLFAFLHRFLLNVDNTKRNFQNQSRVTQSLIKFLATFGKAKCGNKTQTNNAVFAMTIPFQTNWSKSGKMWARPDSLSTILHLVENSVVKTHNINSSSSMCNK